MFQRLVIENSLQWIAYLSFAIMALFFLGSIWLAVKLSKRETHYLSRLPLEDETQPQPDHQANLSASSRRSDVPDFSHSPSKH